MYSYNKCSCPECNEQALSTFDENLDLTDENGWCLKHHPNPEEITRNIFTYIKGHDKIIGLSACGMEFKDISFAGKKFYGCNFQGCSFSNVHASKIRCRMCILDGTTFSDCDFLESNIQFSSFAGSKFVHVLFTGSDLVHINFNGITSYQSSFDDSDLYNTRFIKAALINTSLRNCNLKKAVFYESVRENVSFKLSNTREALVDRNKGGLMGDIDTDFSDDKSKSGVSL